MNEKDMSSWDVEADIENPKSREPKHDIQMELKHVTAKPRKLKAHYTLNEPEESTVEGDFEPEDSVRYVGNIPYADWDEVIRPDALSWWKEVYIASFKENNDVTQARNEANKALEDYTRVIQKLYK